MWQTIGTVLVGLITIAVIVFAVMVCWRFVRGSLDLLSSNSKAKDPREVALRDVKQCLLVSCVTLGYTALKWACIAMEYLKNGVQAEANVYLMFLIVPFGVGIWAVGIIGEIVAIRKICKKDFLRQKLKTSSKVILVVNAILVGICMAELVMIFT